MSGVIRLSDLQIKEVIVINNGRRLGHISDLEIDPNIGKITAIIVIAREKGSTIFGKQEELIINWHQIVTIGTDVILVQDSGELMLPTPTT